MFLLCVKTTVVMGGNASPVENAGLYQEKQGYFTGNTKKNIEPSA